MLRLVLATRNYHKVSEIKGILKSARLKAKLLTLREFPKCPPVIENQPTLEGNAIKKAKSVARYTKEWALADDTGLFIKSLRGRPGVYSARFAGPRCDFKDNNNKVLRLMKNIPDRKRVANFRCVAAFASPQGKVVLAQGSLSGKILKELRGARGFGYDPIFYVPKLGKALAEMTEKQKNEISHRFRAFSKIPSLLRRIQQGKL